MTRQEFIEDVNDFWDLKEFCYENNLDTCDNIYDAESYNDFINECVIDWARQDNWWELLQRLADLPRNYDWYYCGDYDWEEADFQDFKDEVLDEMDRYGDWDEEEEEEEDEEFDFEDSQQEDDDEPEVSFEAFLCVLEGVV